MTIRIFLIWARFFILLLAVLYIVAAYLIADWSWLLVIIMKLPSWGLTGYGVLGLPVIAAGLLAGVMTAAVVDHNKEENR